MPVRDMTDDGGSYWKLEPRDDRRNPPWGLWIELTDDELADYERVIAEFEAWQKRLDERYASVTFPKAAGR